MEKIIKFLCLKGGKNPVRKNSSHWDCEIIYKTQNAKEREKVMKNFGESERVRWLKKREGWIKWIFQDRIFGLIQELKFI